MPARGCAPVPLTGGGHSSEKEKKKRERERDRDRDRERERELVANHTPTLPGADSFHLTGNILQDQVSEDRRRSKLQ